MIDLNKLQAKIDSVLSMETEESLLSWFEAKRKMNDYSNFLRYHIINLQSLKGSMWFYPTNDLFFSYNFDNKIIGDLIPAEGRYLNYLKELQAKRTYEPILNKPMVEKPPFPIDQMKSEFNFSDGNSDYNLAA